MFHPDQRYNLRALQHQDLHADAARIRLAAQASQATNQRLGHAATTMKRLALRLGVWLRPSPITRTRASRG